MITVPQRNYQNHALNFCAAKKILQNVRMTATNAYTNFVFTAIIISKANAKAASNRSSKCYSKQNQARRFYYNHRA